MRSTLAVLTLSLCVTGASACTPSTSASSFSTPESMRTQQVSFGRVIAVRGVDIRPGQTRIGLVTGALLGGIGGASLSNRSGRSLAGGIAGAVAGGAIGSAIQGSSNTPGVEVTISVQDGETVAIVQPGTVNDFRVGDNVRIVGDADNARVVR